LEFGRSQLNGLREKIDRAPSGPPRHEVDIGYPEDDIAKPEGEQNPASLSNKAKTVLQGRFVSTGRPSFFSASPSAQTDRRWLRIPNS
jgi:hypothetical protein